jgi:hypothetical protein
MPTRAQRRRGRRAWSQARNVLGREAAASLAGRSRRPTLLRRLQQRRRPRGRLRDHLRRLPGLPGPRRRVGTTRAGNGSRGWSRAQKPAEGSMRERGLGTTYVLEHLAQPVVQASVCSRGPQCFDARTHGSAQPARIAHTAWLKQATAVGQSRVDGRTWDRTRKGPKRPNLSRAPCRARSRCGVKDLRFAGALRPSSVRSYRMAESTYGHFDERSTGLSGHR